MTELLELREKRKELVNKADRFLKAHTDADGKILKSDAKKFDEMMDEADAAIEEYNSALLKKIGDIEKRIRMEETSYMGYSTKPILLPCNQGEPTCEGRGIVGDEYKKNFMNAIRTNFKNNYLREGSLPDGGYLLPVEWHDEIISALSQANILREIGRVIQTASEHKISIVATKPQAAWVAEGQEISFTKETFNQISLNAYKIAIAIKISTELLQDSYYDIESHLTQEFSTAIGATEEEAMLLGDGNNMPKGLIPTLAQSASGTLQTTGAEISADDLLTLQFSLRRPYRKSAVWLTSDAGLAMIRRLKDTTGNFIWQPSLTETEPSKLFGQAIYTSEFMPAPTAGNVAVLYGDFKNYFLIGERGQMEMQPLREIFAMSGQVAYLMTSRVDSVLSNPEAIRGLKIRA